jgi:hypothetical protein
MALAAPTLIAHGRHHADVEGVITVGPGDGEVPAFGLNQLMTVDITAFEEVIRNYLGFEDQFYIWFQSLDGNVTDVRLDAQEFGIDSEGVPITLRIRVDITANATVKMILESHHSAGR